MADRETERRRREDELVQVYEEGYERVVRYIFARIGHRDEAEDLASEVFVKALRSLGSYEERGLPMLAWVFRIAHNLVVDHLRKTSKKQLVRIDEMVVPDLSDPQEAAEFTDEVERLSRALEHLSPAQREVVALRFFSGLSAADCATILGKKPGTVREMQSAAIKSLRRVMDFS